jgi:Membrane carboxypeptidase (penicillin-binding protein)
VKSRDDINRYNTSSERVVSGRAEGELSKVAGATAKTIGGMLWRTIKTVILITMLTGLIVFISVATYIMSMSDIVPPNISVMKLSLSSFIYTQNTDTGEFEKYGILPASETRVWVEDKNIPQAMKEAMMAIEDKRFLQHQGVDIIGSGSAVLSLLSNDNRGGGSTLTQQLIKNLTQQNQVSLKRKINEIFLALNMEQKYSKQEILHAYLNVVNFGGNTNGVQAAAQLYFGKDIADCDIAECASIAGITQYPYRYNPLYNPEANYKRQVTVLGQMYEQERITKQEYDEAMKKAKNMEFAKYDGTGETEKLAQSDIWNWYEEAMITDIVRDLQESQGISREAALTMLYNGGLKIYTAMNPTVQKGVEVLLKNEEFLPYDPEVEFGVCVMDYTGKMIAIVGSRKDKTGNRWLNLATDTQRQTGSSIKPLAVYAPALENGFITYGTVLKDQKIEDYFEDGKPGPENYSRTQEEFMNVDRAVEISQNMPATQLVKAMGLDIPFDFLTKKLHFSGLEEAGDKHLGPLSLGGFTKGATVQQVTAAYQIFGNGGLYNEPYTYYYVESENNVILDNRDKMPERVLSEENAAVMNKLLHRPIEGKNGTAQMLKMEGIDVFGKTGTTDNEYDFWLLGGTQLFAAGVWNGYADRQVRLSEDATAKYMWKAVVQYLHENHSDVLDGNGFYISDNIVERRFCKTSGLIAGARCFSTDTGWYADTEKGIPKKCNGGSDHASRGKLHSPSPSGDPDEDEESEEDAEEKTPKPNKTEKPEKTEKPQQNEQEKPKPTPQPQKTNAPPAPTPQPPAPTPQPPTPTQPPEFEPEPELPSFPPVPPPEEGTFNALFE